MSEHDDAGRMSRRRVLGGAGALAGGGLVAATAVVATAVSAGASSSAGSTLAEFVAQIDQNGGALVAYGFLNRLEGLTAADLFSDSTHPSETTALYTAFARGTLVSRVVRGAVTVLDVEGEMSFYKRSSPGASFSSPASFRVGTRGARYTLVLQDVLTVIGTDTGVPTLGGDLTKEGALLAPFDVLGPSLRLNATGLGTRSDAVAPKATLTIAGNLVGT
jgi:hypothetical protein